METKSNRVRFSMGIQARGAAAAALLTLGVAVGSPAQAAGSHDANAHHAGTTGLMGQAAAASEADRKVAIELVDNAYDPAEVDVKAGETLRFVVTNNGTLVHEFNIGTPAMHAVHRQEMMEMVNEGIIQADRIDRDRMQDGHGMSHSDPNSVLLEPGQSAEIVWTFPRAGTVEIACNVPGHYEAGMKGVIDIR